MNRFLNLSLVIVLLFSTGCSQAKPDPVTAETDQPVIKAAAPVETPKANVEGSTPVALIATAGEGTAEATFQRTLIAFQEGRLDAAYDFLPGSYQTDVDKLVQTFADKMDSDVWSGIFRLLNKTAKLLQTKKALILSLDGVKRLPQIEQIKPHWDTIASGLRDVATSEVADLSKLKGADVRQLLVAGSRLLTGIPLPKFGDVTVTTVKSDAESATLSYKESRDAAPQEVEFVRIEGKWLPKSIATGWTSGMEEARARLGELPAQISAWKPEALKQFDSIAGMLDQLQGAKTAEEFNAAVAPLVFTIAFGAQLAQQAMLDSASAPRKGNAVNCVINRELKDAELTALRDRVLASVGDSGSRSDYELIPNDGKTRCRFTPIVDPQALVEVLKQHFEGANVRWDGATKTISVELN